MSYSQGLASLALRARWVIVFLWLFIAASVLGVPVGLSSQFASDLRIPVAAMRVAVTVVQLMSLVVMLGLLVAIPAWIYRAWTNLRLLGLRGLRHGPVWASLSLFVPIAGLFVPFLAMRELYNRSIGEDEDHARASASDVTSWWTCYVAGMLLTSFIVLTAFFNLNGQVFIVTSRVMDYVLAIFSNILLLGAAWFLIRTIRDITAAQSSSAGISETFA